ncbi:MAG: hypothetical protein RL616_308 [Verrucomicrobiota bacterium]|jgi:ABC-type transporter MlaC component
MKKVLLIAALFCATAIVVQAEDAAAPAKKVKKELTTEQKTLMDDMKAKYDTNKDGKLSKEERAAMSQEDKDKLAAAGLGPKKKAMPAGEEKKKKE